MARKENKINKNQFLEDIAMKHRLPVEDVTAMYDAIVDGIYRVVSQGYILSLTGFGSFYLKEHKGHPVQFEGCASSVDDYVIFKFSASDVLNRQFRKEDKERKKKAALKKKSV